MSSSDDLTPKHPGPQPDPDDFALDQSPPTYPFKSVGGLKIEQSVVDLEEGGVNEGMHPLGKGPPRPLETLGAPPTPEKDAAPPPELQPSPRPEDTTPGTGQTAGAPLPDFTAPEPKWLQVELEFDPYEEGGEIAPVRSGALDAIGSTVVPIAPTLTGPAPPSKIPGPPQVQPPGVLESKTPGPPQRSGSRKGRIGIVLGGILGVIVLGGILAVVVQGGRFPFFYAGCNNPGAQRDLALAALTDPPAPCAIPTTATTNTQPTTLPQATNTPLTQPTATTAPTVAQPTKTPQPAHLTVTPLQASAFCTNGQYPSVTVKNTGSKTLNWSASGPSTPPLTVTPANGSLAPGASKTVAVSGQHPGPTVTITFTSNGGNGTVTYTCA
jgi:hypothetical protein